MSVPIPRLMARSKIFVEKFSWKERLLPTLKFDAHDHLDVIVNGKMLCEDIDYERVIESEKRGILFKKPSTITGWALLKVYK